MTTITEFACAYMQVTKGASTRGYAVARARDNLIPRVFNVHSAAAYNFFEFLELEFPTLVDNSDHNFLNYFRNMRSDEERISEISLQLWSSFGRGYQVAEVHPIPRRVYFDRGIVVPVIIGADSKRYVHGHVLEDVRYYHHKAARMSKEHDIAVLVDLVRAERALLGDDVSMVDIKDKKYDAVVRACRQARQSAA